MDNSEIINKIQKYSINSVYSENEKKIGIKIYSSIGLWIYLIIDKKTYSCKYTTITEVNKKPFKNNLWNIISLNDFYKIFVRPKFNFICLGLNKPKELKNIFPAYSVNFDCHKIQIFIKENDLFICFPKYSYNLTHSFYFKLHNFKQLYFAVEELFERPETILKIYLTRCFWEITVNAKEKSGKVTLDDYLTNQLLLELFRDTVIKYREIVICQAQK